MSIGRRTAAWLPLLLLLCASRLEAQSADLSLAKSDSPDPVVSGTNLTYTVTLTNAGPDAAAAVSVTDAIPANTTFVSLTSPAGWTATTPPVGGTGTVTMSNPTLASGASAVFTLVVNVNSGTAGGTVISNTAAATSSTADPNAANNSSTATTTVTIPTADLSIAKTDSIDPLPTGINLTYTIVLANNGPASAVNVSVTDAIPANTTFVSLTSPAGWTATTPPVGGTGTVTMTNPTVASGVSATFNLVVSVNAGTPLGTVLTNTAAATSSTSDPNPANNSDTETTIVGLFANLFISKVATFTPVPAGANIAYVITVSNGGPLPAANVSVTDTIPANTTFVSMTVPAGWTVTTPPVGGTGTVTATHPGLLSGATSTMALVLNVNPATPAGTIIGNTVAATSTTADPNLADNAAVATITVAGAVPTLQTWLLIGLGGLLLFIGWHAVRRRTGGLRA